MWEDSRLHSPVDSSWLDDKLEDYYFVKGLRWTGCNWELPLDGGVRSRMGPQAGMVTITVVKIM